jgi:hypothetical protein
VDPDPDPGDPKTCGSGGSGSGSGTLQKTRDLRKTSTKCKEVWNFLIKVKLKIKNKVP